MATSDTELRSQVRKLTDYTSKTNLTEEALGDVFDIAKRDIQGEANRSIDGWYTDRNTENALFWTACLFTKIKAGELDGVPMSLGDIDYDTLKSAGNRKDENPVIWYEKAQRYIRRLEPESARFASTQIDRGQSRAYGSESGITDSIDYGGDNT